MMEKKRVEEIKIRCDLASDGKWYRSGACVKISVPGCNYRSGFLIVANCMNDRYGCKPDGRTFRSKAELDAEFIAHAKDDVPDLILAVEKLHKENTQLREELANHTRRKKIM